MAETIMPHSSSKNAGFAGLRLGLSPGIWLLAAFICIGPFIVQALIVAIAGNAGASLAAAGLHFVLSINAGLVAYTGTHKKISDIPGGSLISLILAAFTYNALAVILARFFISA